MVKVLITAATGNVGIEVIKALYQIDHQLHLFAGVRDVQAGKIVWAKFNITCVQFDFTDASTYNTALNGCDILFLLRPPQISAVKKYFTPIIDTCKNMGVKHIVFLSVQGVKNSKLIPHHTIEKLIVASNIHYTFLQPAYFMQNFTTNLRSDLVNKKRIYLPAGNAKFTLIDIRDIGAVSANILTNILQHINTSYELTCNQKLTFKEMAMILSANLGMKIQYKSPNLFRFFLTKKKENVPTMFILVMIMLHYFPRFKKAPETTDWVEKIVNRPPITFEQFVNDNKNILTS